MSEEIKIEKGIPLARSLHKAGFPATVRKMDVGDSFVTARKNYCAVFSAFKSVGFRCTSLKLSETEIRIWRIADKPEQSQP